MVENLNGLIASTTQSQTQVVIGIWHPLTGFGDDDLTEVKRAAIGSLMFEPPDEKTPTCRLFKSSDIVAAHALSLAAGWPHRAEDWKSKQDP